MLSLLQCQVIYLRNDFIYTENIFIKLTEKEAIKIWKLCNFRNLHCRMVKLTKGW